MHPLVRALFGPWEFRPEVLVVMVPLTIIYLVGWVRLRRQGKRKIANRWRLASYVTGMGTLAISLMSPIDILGGQLFFMHMIQHKIAVMIGAPFPIGLWGLPRGLRKSMTHVFSDASSIRPLLETITQPFVIWGTFVVVYIGWHDPNLYNLALRIGWVHDIQHITFFTTALAFWWLTLGGAPKLHAGMSPWIPIVMLLGVIPFNAITGFVIANSESIVYSYYESVPRIWGVSLLDDQATGGVIMWVPGSEMFFQAAGALLALMFIRDRKKNQQAVPLADEIDDAALIAPGLEHRAEENAIRNKWREVTSS
jgi:putative membrane protein